VVVGTKRSIRTRVVRARCAKRIKKISFIESVSSVSRTRKDEQGKMAQKDQQKDHVPSSTICTKPITFKNETKIVHQKTFFTGAIIENQKPILSTTGEALQGEEKKINNEESAKPLVCTMKNPIIKIESEIYPQLKVNDTDEKSSLRFNVPKTPSLKQRDQSQKTHLLSVVCQSLRKRQVTVGHRSDAPVKPRCTQNKMDEPLISKDVTDIVKSQTAVSAKTNVVANSEKSKTITQSNSELVSLTRGRFSVGSHFKKKRMFVQQSGQIAKYNVSVDTDLSTKKRRKLESIDQDTGSSHNPIYLDSDEGGCAQVPLGVAVDQICIGRFICKRRSDSFTQFACPSVQCSDNHFTLHVWEIERDADTEKDMTVSFEIVIAYASLTYAAFSKKNNSGYCVFTISNSPTEILTHNKSSKTKLQGRFQYDSESMLERSIVITSTPRNQIHRLRKEFIKICPDMMKKLLRRKSRKKKATAFLKAHGIRLKPNLQEKRKMGGNCEILIYPRRESSHGAVTLTENDVSRLQPRQYLNDNILDFYLRYLFLEKWDDSLRRRVYVFNTFFFKKWIGFHNCDYLSRYNQVKKWTKNVNIFNKDFLVIPVNYKLHWSLGIVCFPGEVIKEKTSTDRRCCILGFDSLRKFRSSHFLEIRRYLNMAWCNRNVGTSPSGLSQELPFSDERCASISLRTPTQRNGKDCGVFVLHNCELFFETGGFSDYSNPSPGVNWYPPSDISQKRVQIMELISRKSGRNLKNEL